MDRIEAVLRQYAGQSFSTGPNGWPLLKEAADRIAELEAALKRSENLLTALAAGMSQNATVDLVCDERHLIAVLVEVRAALQPATNS